MKTLASVLLIVAALAVNLVSDIMIRPTNPELAQGWDWTAGIVILFGFYGFLRSLNKKDES